MDRLHEPGAAPTTDHPLTVEVHAHAPTAFYHRTPCQRFLKSLRHNVQQYLAFIVGVFAPSALKGGRVVVVLGRGETCVRRDLGHVTDYIVAHLRSQDSADAEDRTERR